MEALFECCENVVYRCQIVKLYLLVAGCITSRHRLRLATARALQSSAWEMSATVISPKHRTSPCIQTRTGYMTLDNLLANVFSEAHSVTDPGSAERCSGRRACLSVPESLCLCVSMLGVSLLSRTRTAHS